MSLIDLRFFSSETSYIFRISYIYLCWENRAASIQMQTMESSRRPVAFFQVLLFLIVPDLE